MTPSHSTTRRLIEEWLPINELSVEAIREGVLLAGALPPLNWLHVWWARRPLTVSRAAVAASLLIAGRLSIRTLLQLDGYALRLSSKNSVNWI